jgi:hypothetical protein
MCNVMHDSDVPPPALLLCKSGAGMLAVDSPIYRSRTDGEIWASPSKICDTYSPVASQKGLTNYMLHCTHDETGKIQQQLLDAGDGASAHRAMMGKGSPGGAQDLIDDDGKVVDFAQAFNAAEDGNIISGAERVPGPSSMPEGMGVKPVQAHMSDLGSSVPYSYMNTVRDAEKLYSYFTSGEIEAHDYYSALDPKPILSDLVKVGKAQASVKDVMDCVDAKMKEGTPGFQAVDAYKACKAEAAKALWTRPSARLQTAPGQ